MKIKLRKLVCLVKLIYDDLWGVFMVTKEEYIEILTGNLVRVCSRCGCEVVFDDSGDFVTPSYDCACLVCDEDMDLWETCLVPKDEVRLFISSEDKEYYRKFGHIILR